MVLPIINFCGDENLLIFIFKIDYVFNFEISRG